MLVTATCMHVLVACAGLLSAVSADSEHSSPSKPPPPPPLYTFSELYALQTKFWDHFLSPANAAEAASINSSLLADDILGRVDVSRTFTGRELNTEYLFGLFANLATPASEASLSLLGVPVAYNITHFAAEQNLAAASTIVTFNISAAGDWLAPVEILTWITWDAAGAIAQYDATFRYFDFLMATVTQRAATLLGLNSTAAAQAYFTRGLAQSICGVAQAYCNGTNIQYASYNACYAFLTQDIRFGEPYELGGNTLLCRMVHENLVPFRPAVHCPHIGPTGGGLCVDDQTYEQRVTEPYFTNEPFVPFGYANENATIAAEK